VKWWQLNDGTALPPTGFGYPRVDAAAAEELFCNALEAGYRLIDTAASYRNEEAIGRAIKRAGVDRGDIIVSTKMRGADQGYRQTLVAFERSRQKLQLDYVDLYLIHWPNPRLGRYLETWEAMIELREKRLVRSIGVCNFTGPLIEELEQRTGVLPSVNQIERHPAFPNLAQVKFDNARGIVTQSWSALGRGADFLCGDVLTRIASDHGVTPAQVVLRWHIEEGTVPLVQTTKRARMTENLEIFGFELTSAEVEAIDALETGRLWGQDPHEYISL
jgi:2,5-diketo-D-gluconate reductase A